MAHGISFDQEVRVRFTPQEIGQALSTAFDEEQAGVINEFAKNLILLGSAKRENQLYDIAEYLDKDGVELLKHLVEYYELKDQNQ